MTAVETKRESALKLLDAAVHEVADNPLSGRARGRVTVLREEIRRLEQQIARAARRK